MTQEHILAAFEQLARGLGSETTTRLSLDAVISELGIDSLAMAQIVLDLEQRLGVDIPDGELMDVVTVEDLVRVVERRLAHVASGPLDGSAGR